MSYTVPKGVAQGKPLNEVSFLRQALIAEIIAINGYEYHIASSPIKELNEIWHHIMEEEKRHYGMFLELIREFDPKQREAYYAEKDMVKISNKKIPNCIIIPEDCYLNLVRNDIKGENEAVLLYEENLANISNNYIRQVYYEIILDEKKHIEELTSAMIQYDKQNYGPINI